MSTEPIFTGTPDDWWANAEDITQAEADNRNLGDWYIVMYHNASGKLRPSYRVSTPNSPPNMATRENSSHRIATNVRCLIRNSDPVPAWRIAPLVVADSLDGTGTRVPWIRKGAGRWQSLVDGRQKVSDYEMEDLNPTPAHIAEGVQ